MKKKNYNFSYDSLLDIYKIINTYNTIKSNCKHKNKIFNYEMFYTSHMINIINVLEEKKYKHGRYNIFIISDPKCRIIMSENMYDKIINHLVSNYILFPLIEPLLIDTNVATRVGKGTKAGIYYMKKYINTLKENYHNFYVLKCDIFKFFYSIDHDILFDKLKKIIKDKDIFNLVCEIVNSTNYSYLEETITKIINNRKREISKLKISENEKKIKYRELDKIPLYKYNKGLPIGNMSSQIFAIFYLNDLDHFIKEKLKIKYYIRYMDDLVLFHNDKEYLKYCYKEIEKIVNKYKLSINDKTQIVEIHNGITFLGYKFILKKNRLYMLMSSKTKRRINKKLKYVDKSNRRKYLKERYNGYLNYGDTKGFIYGNERI